MISYTNEKMSPYDMANVSLDEAFTYFNAGINNALYEFDMGLLLNEYTYLQEHGYEIPLNEGWDEFKAWSMRTWEKIKQWVLGISRKVSDWFKEKAAEVKRWFMKIGFDKAKANKAIEAITADRNNNIEIIMSKYAIDDIMNASITPPTLEERIKAFEDEISEVIDKSIAKTMDDGTGNEVLISNLKKQEEYLRQYLEKRKPEAEQPASISKSDMKHIITKEIAKAALAVVNNVDKDSSAVFKKKQNQMKIWEKAFDKLIKDEKDPEYITAYRKTLNTCTRYITSLTNIQFKAIQINFSNALKIVKKVVAKADTKATT